MNDNAPVVAFDLDDTLYKEMDFVYSGYRAVARRLADATGADAGRLFDIIAAGRPRGFEDALEYIAGLDDAERFTVDSMVEDYRAHKPEICLDGDAEAALTRLKAAGVHTVLITDGSTRHQRSKFAALGLDRFFAPEDILISEETGGDKTTLVPWTLVEERYRGHRLTYVGDNLVKDFYHPNQRGWRTVMLRDRGCRNVFAQRPTEYAALYRPQITIDTLLQVPFIIAKTKSTFLQNEKYNFRDFLAALLITV